MHIKFLARGTGSARAAADYLLGARDATGQLREGVEVLRGDPHQVAAVADALGFEHKYTSGVIAWAPDDTPTDAQIEAVLDEFERTAWAGLEHAVPAPARILERELVGLGRGHHQAPRRREQLGEAPRDRVPLRAAQGRAVRGARGVTGVGDHDHPLGRVLAVERPRQGECEDDGQDPEGGPHRERSGGPGRDRSQGAPPREPKKPRSD